MRIYGRSQGKMNECAFPRMKRGIIGSLLKKYRLAVKFSCGFHLQVIVANFATNFPFGVSQSTFCCEF